MALSGSVSTTDYQGRFVKVSWTATQNTSKNQSTITWTVEGDGTATSSWYNAGPFYVNVAGTEKTSSTRIQLKDGTRITACEGSTTITHNSEGKASFTISVKAAIYQASYNCTGSKKFTLDTIPRKATITSAPNFSDEDTPTVKYSNPAGGTLQIGIYKTDGETALVSYRACSGSSYKFTFTSAEKTTLQNACKNAQSMSVRIYLKTTLGGKTYYHYVSKTLSIANAIPTLSPTAIEEQDENGVKNTQATGSNTRWVKGYSDIAYAFNASAKKGATITYYNVICGTDSESGKSSGVLYNINSKDVVFQVVDSRGNRATQTVSGTLINYAKPTINISASGELVSDTMAKITLGIKGTYFNGQIKSGVNNTLTFQYRHKAGTNGSWGSWTALTGGSYSNGSFNFTKVIGENFDYNLTHTFQVRVQDNFYLAHGSWIESNQPVVKIKPIFDWSETDFNFNVPITVNGLNLSGAAKALSTIYNLDTTGTTGGTNWTVSSFTAQLIGNQVRCAYSWTRSSATGAGNITNEEVASVKLKHSGKIKAAYGSGFSSGSTGSVATYTTANAENDGTYLTFNVNIAATASALTSSSGTFTLPVVLNLDKY